MPCCAGAGEPSSAAPPSCRCPPAAHRAGPARPTRSRCRSRARWCQGPRGRRAGGAAPIPGCRRCPSAPGPAPPPTSARRDRRTRRRTGPTPRDCAGRAPGGPAPSSRRARTGRHGRDAGTLARLEQRDRTSARRPAGRRSGHAPRPPPPMRRTRRRSPRRRRAARSGRRVGAVCSDPSSDRPTVTCSVEGSRPSASQAARRSANRLCQRSSGTPNQAVFQASAWRAVRRSMRSPLDAMRIGMCARRGGRQEDLSSTRCHRPVEGHAFAVEERPDDPERLLEPPDTVIERVAERRELRLVPARPEPDDQPADR